MSFPIGSPLEPNLSEIFNVKYNAMVDVTLIRPLNKGQGHSFWYKSISYIRLPIGFCSRTNRSATVHNVTDDDRHTDDGRNSVPISATAAIGG